MKKIIVMLLAVMMLSVCTVANASDFFPYGEKEITVTYNGDLISFDTEPQIINNRTMVPLRKLVETLDGEVEFLAETKEVLCNVEGKTIVFRPGESEAIIKSNAKEEKITLDAAPVIVNDRTLVPVRFLAETIGIKVNWSEWDQEVVLFDTDILRDEIKAKSEFLDVILNSKIFPEGKFTSIENGEVNYTIGIIYPDEPSAEENNVPQNVDLSFSFNANALTSYDGKNIKEDGTFELDLSTFKSLFEQMGVWNETKMTEKEIAQVNAVFKKHNIKIEVIMDKDYNIYLKSPDIMNLITVFDGGQIETMIGEKYVLIPLGKILEERFAKYALSLKEATLWDVLECFVFSDEYFDTEMVKALKLVFNSMAEMYSDEKIIKEEKEDKTVVYTYNMDKQVYRDNLENYFKKIYVYDELTEEEKIIIDETIKENLALIDAMEYNVNLSFEVKNGVIFKADSKSKVELKDYLIPGTETEKALMNILAESVVSAVIDDKVDVSTIIVPTDVFDITTIQ